MTNEQKIIVQGLESLVHHRFNFSTLTQELESLFGTKVELYPSESEAVDLLGDYCWEFAVGEDFGVFEIYYLPHKITDGNGNDFYVTEVGYSFGC